ncbi:hypothetical protein BDY17DRAFT_306680 [Neohortaea acidophila]|uniref:DUF6314 domain-containing protein n=1 Tax=Neohortaea acidophila TaxID=245834 RepID=A0A6A6Q7C4_9PEZI|nr:uncharacterized protein BDY17DRAFT_306680 [Neohortaea acidophila]KAF2487277.1 hypothetical protein BDY17DRAFT_306680 [Neohortaea acidophila]
MSVNTPVRLIFESLKGSWRLKRSLNSVLAGFPSGIFEGSATFKPRANAHSELLYSEQGELKMDNGVTLTANRKYVYRYSTDEDKISAWFVTEESKQNDGREELDYLFHDLELEQVDGGWVGRGEHLCEMDAYWAFYDFRPSKLTTELANKAVDVFGVRYKVKGPQKDYTSDTAYQRVLE